MEKSIYQKLKLGIFVISGIVLFLAMIWFIGEKKSMFGNNVEIYAVFNNINGLKNGNNVRFSGINVGTVKDIRMVSDTMIVVKLNVDKDITNHIKTDAKVVITSDGLVGAMIVNILPGDGGKVSLLVGDTLKSMSRLRTDEMLNTLSITNENAAVLTAELLKIAKEISEGKGVIGALLRDSTITEDVTQTLHFLKKTSMESNTAMKNVSNLITSLDNKNTFVGMAKDTSMVKQIKRIVENIEKSSRDLEMVIQNANATIQNANSTVLNMKDGKGAINYLSNDRNLVRKIDFTATKLDSVMQHINEASVKLNQNLEAMKHNFLLRGYFKKLENVENKK
ncbi:MAG: MCE family protein [Saprospiraceae bacterium]|nr:MCE family protein [Saprospiraceae bacterium]